MFFNVCKKPVEVAPYWNVNCISGSYCAFGIPRIINKIFNSSLIIDNTKNENTINSYIIMLAVNETELG